MAGIKTQQNLLRELYRYGVVMTEPVIHRYDYSITDLMLLHLGTPSNAWNRPTIV